jgi:large subunit ribosomal protein L22
MTDVKAISKNIRISPEKVNLLAVQIKKMNPLEAINVLAMVNKSSAPILKKIIMSAVANAKHNFSLSESDLFFKEIIVTKGPMSKRYQPISRGRAHHILKRTSHVTIILGQKPKENVQTDSKISNEESKGATKIRNSSSRQGTTQFEIRNLKDISKVIIPNPLLLPYQVKLVIWMSTYYIAPMVNCLEAMLPEIPKKLLSVHSSQFTVKSVNRQSSTVNQTLILVPSINHLPQVMSQFPQAKNHAIYTNELNVSERLTVWQKILFGACDFVFGSRSVIFAPCPNLKKIIIFGDC